MRSFFLILCLFFSGVSGFHTIHPYQKQLIRRKETSITKFEHASLRAENANVITTTEESATSTGSIPGPKLYAWSVTSLHTLMVFSLISLKKSGSFTEGFINDLPLLGNMWAAGVSSNALASAAARNRLEGNTFKVLNMGQFVSSVLVSIVATYLFCLKASSIAVRGKIPTDILLYFTVGIIGGIPSFKALRNFGIPKFKLELKLSPTLAMGYLFAAALSVAAQSFSIMFYPGSASAVVRAVSSTITMTTFSLALHGASIVGPKRLSSETYKGLNSAMTIYLICNAVESIYKGNPWIVIASIFGAVIAQLGFRAGANYNEQTDRTDSTKQD